MIIVSQNKRLLNYDNVVDIYKTFGNEKNVCIEATTVNDEYLDLGEYDTEERADEVLEEIAERYTNWNNLVYGQLTGACSPKYEMPKE